MPFLCVKTSFRSSRQEVFLPKGVPKICSKFIGEHPYRNAISIKLQSNFIEIALRHGYSPLNLLHIFRTPFSKNTSGLLLLFLTVHFVLHNLIKRPKTVVCLKYITTVSKDSDKKSSQHMWVLQVTFSSLKCFS